jgi:hypothetical protein
MVKVMACSKHLIRFKKGALGPLIRTVTYNNNPYTVRAPIYCSFKASLYHVHFQLSEVRELGVCHDSQIHCFWVGGLSLEFLVWTW